MRNVISLIENERANKKVAWQVKLLADVQTSTRENGETPSTFYEQFKSSVAKYSVYKRALTVSKSRQFALMMLKLHQ